MKHSWSIASSTGGFFVAGGGAPRCDQTVTNPSRAGWNGLSSSKTAAQRNLRQACGGGTIQVMHPPRRKRHTKRSRRLQPRRPNPYWRLQRLRERGTKAFASSAVIAQTPIAPMSGYSACIFQPVAQMAPRPTGPPYLECSSESSPVSCGTRTLAGVYATGCFMQRSLRD